MTAEASILQDQSSEQAQYANSKTARISGQSPQCFVSTAP